MQVNTVSAATEIAELKLDSINVKSVSGRLTAKNVQAKRTDIGAEYSQFDNDVRLKTTSGTSSDSHFQGSTGNSSNTINAESVSGDLEILVARRTG